MYTKEHARENGQMLALAKELLAEKGDGVVGTTDVYSKLSDKFPGVAKDRINFWIDRAERSLKGKEVRRRGAPPGNQNARKSSGPTVRLTVRLPPKAIARLKGRALERGISVADYIEMLSRLSN